MARDNNQGKQPKHQADQGKKLSTNESIKNIGSADACGAQRVRKGSAADGTSSTGPRKTE